MYSIFNKTKKLIYDITLIKMQFHYIILIVSSNTINLIIYYTSNN